MDDGLEEHTLKVIKALSPDGDAVQEAVRANLRLESKLGTRHEKAIRDKKEKYLLSNHDFKSAIEDARKELGIPEGTNVDELDINDWIKERFGWPSTLFHSVRSKTLDRLGLGVEWSFYIAVFIVNNRPPNDFFSAVMPDTGITVNHVKKNELNISLSPGLSKKNYIEAWDVFKDYLGKPKRTPKADTYAERDEKIYSDFKSGINKRELAKKYFPNDVGDESSFEKIKQIIKRQKSRRGTPK